LEDAGLGVGDEGARDVGPNPAERGEHSLSLVGGVELKVDQDVVGVVDGALDL
jgi:hypothetical protein